MKLKTNLRIKKSAYIRHKIQKHHTRRLDNYISIQSRLVQKYTFTFFEKVKVNLTFFKNIFVQVKYSLLDKSIIKL